MEENPDRLAQEIAVDVSASVQISAAFLPEMVKAGNGFLINVASMAAYTPTPRMAVYGAAKAFVLSFTESLWAGTRGTGVTVFALSPGATALTHLARCNPGPSVIDGPLNRTSAAAVRMLSRRATATVMHRVTDPTPRKNADLVR